jgi:hypothetical protein
MTEKTETKIEELEALLTQPNLTKKEIRSIKYKIWYRKNKAKHCKNLSKNYVKNIEKRREEQRQYYYNVTKKNKPVRKIGRPRKYQISTEVSVN